MVSYWQAVFNCLICINIFNTVLVCFCYLCCSLPLSDSGLLNPDSHDESVDKHGECCCHAATYLQSIKTIRDNL